MGLKFSPEDHAGLRGYRLKSDQNGIEMENKQLERAKQENRLKSDQNGIEI